MSGPAESTEPDRVVTSAHMPHPNIEPVPSQTSASGTQNGTRAPHRRTIISRPATAANSRMPKEPSTRAAVLAVRPVTIRAGSPHPEPSAQARCAVPTKAARTATPEANTFCSPWVAPGGASPTWVPNSAGQRVRAYSTNAVISASPSTTKPVYTIAYTHGRTGPSALTGVWPLIRAARAANGATTAIGASRPLPTHIGNATSQAGTRSPKLCVKVNATSTATRSMPAVSTLSGTRPGLCSREGSTPIGAPDSQASFSAKYGSAAATAVYPTTSRGRETVRVMRLSIRRTRPSNLPPHGDPPPPHGGIPRRAAHGPPRAPAADPSRRRTPGRAASRSRPAEGAP